MICMVMGVMGGCGRIWWVFMSADGLCGTQMLWFMVYGLWFMVYGSWFMVYGSWFMVYGLWFMVYGLWFMV